MTAQELARHLSPMNYVHNTRVVDESTVEYSAMYWVPQHPDVVAVIATYRLIDGEWRGTPAPGYDQETVDRRLHRALSRS